MKKVVLASASPRRRELLAQAGIEYEVYPSQVEEHVTECMPEKLVMALAYQKAMDVAGSVLTCDDSRVVLGADTVVVYDHQILGKPKDEQDARRILRMLSGRTHHVYTGVCLVQNEHGVLKYHTFYEKTDVTMYEIEETQIDWYISTNEPFDKAGAYGIQGYGGVFISGICGDYNNVVGLPLAKVWQYLYQHS